MRAILPLLLLIHFASPAFALSGATFTPLGDLPGTPYWPDRPDSVGYAVSADGSTAVGRSLQEAQWPDSGYRAFRWNRDAGMTSLGDLPGGAEHSYAVAVSGDGAVVTGVANHHQGANFDVYPEGQEAFRWTESEGMVGLGSLPGGRFQSMAWDISDDGAAIVGASWSDNGLEAFRWTEAEGMVGLGGFPGGDFSVAEAISGGGEVIVGLGSNGHHSEAFRWTEASGLISLGMLPGARASHATSVSFDGSVIIGENHYDDFYRPFRWTETTGMIELEAPAGTQGDYFASDVSADGSVIVGSAYGGQRAAIWTAAYGSRYLLDLLQDDYGLDLSGWQLRNASGISADGKTIAGYGTDPDGNLMGWLVVIPEPSTALLLGLGLAWIARSSSRAR